MKHCVLAVSAEGAHQSREVSDIPLHTTRRGVAVLVIENRYLMPISLQGIYYVASDKATSAGYNYFHRLILFLITFRILGFQGRDLSGGIDCA